MSRKSNLIHIYTQALKTTNKGAFATQQTKLKTMRLIVEDLFFLKCAPYNWQELSIEQIFKLINFWKNKAIKTTTIAKRISALRKMCLLIDSAMQFPSNKELKLQISNINNKNTFSCAIENNILNKIKHPITKTIIELEMLFGLTKSESIKLQDYSVSEDKIIVYRDIAYNHYDRTIPVTTKQQFDSLTRRRQVISDYQGQNNLLQIASFVKLSTLYRSELAILNIEGHSRFRIQYARERFKNLEQKFTENKTIKILQKELGLTSSRLLKEWIK